MVGGIDYRFANTQKGTDHHRSHAQKSDISGTPETHRVSQWTGGMLASLGAVPLEH